MRGGTTSLGARALIVLGVLLTSAAARVRAEVIHIPVGGRPIPLGEGRVACDAPGRGFGGEAGGRTVRPPMSSEGIGQSLELRVAPTLAACDESSASLTLVATGKLPEIVRDSVWFASDEGRVDARGANLAGSSIVWKSEATFGVDTCHAPETLPTGGELCSWSIPRGFSVAPEDTHFFLLPAGAHVLDGAIFHDQAGLKIPLDSLVLRPARTTLLRVVNPDASVDLSTGQGEVPLLHPEAVQSADCGALSCEMLKGKLVVRAGVKALSSLEIKVRLVPDVFVSRKDAFESTVSVKLPVVHCPMTIVSGAPFRDNEDA